MEGRGEERDIGMPNSMGYNPPQIIQESSPSPLKLPLAPILSTPHDRRATAMVSTRRGTSIFSPIQTLDPPPQQHHQQSSPPPHNDPDLDLDPLPSTTTDVASKPRNPAPPPPPPQPHVAPPQAAAGGGATTCSSSASIRYKECLKNHDASRGGHVLDGCGEFMPGGEEGTPEALRCAACDCHRNFHRKEVEGQQQPQPQQQSHFGGGNDSHRAPLIQGQTSSQLQQHHKYSHPHLQGFATGHVPPTMVSFGGTSGGAAAESSSEDLNFYHSSDGGHAAVHPSFLGSKKRFRTKFSQDQKDRMHEFATKLGWRIQKQDEQEVQQFCNEVGVKRQVFKVWMHNNKQAMKKKQI